jgi:DNA-binding XRE family transcriptional regulator
MGDIFKAECPCGFKSRDLFVGCGMMDTDACGMPVACPQCHSVWVEDWKSGKRTCRKCKLALSRRLRELRAEKHLTQTTLAAALKTSQSRVAKMEKGDPTVSVDLLLQALFRLGATRRELAQAICVEPCQGLQAGAGGGT